MGRARLAVFCVLFKGLCHRRPDYRVGTQALLSVCLCLSVTVNVLLFLSLHLYLSLTVSDFLCFFFLFYCCVCACMCARMCVYVWACPCHSVPVESEGFWGSVFFFCQVGSGNQLRFPGLTTVPLLSKPSSQSLSLFSF